MELKQPIFILGAHKSGTSLLRNLLDGHPELFCVPFEAHLFMLLGYWIDCDYRRSYPQKTDFKKYAVEFVIASNAAVDDIGDSFTRGAIDEHVFEEAFKDLPIDNDIVRLFYAVAKGLGTDLSTKKMVEKSVENAEFAVDLKQLFPDAKFIHIVRNPYSNWVSMRKYKSVDYGYPLVHRMVATFNNSFYYLDKNKRLLKDDYLIVKYEDLLTNSKATLEKVCGHIDIKWDDVLLSPTLLGKEWKGNSSTGKKMEGISGSGLNSWEKEISSFEVSLINKHFSHVVNKYGYDHFEKAGNKLKKHKGESFSRYLLNRIYPYYY